MTIKLDNTFATVISSAVQYIRTQQYQTEYEKRSGTLKIFTAHFDA